MSSKLAGGKGYYYGLFHNGNQIGFQAFSNYVPTRKGQNPIYHSNRTVIHPDYAGLGMGITLINECSRLFKEKHPSFKIMAKFSSIPVYKAMIRSSQWRFLGAKRLLGKMKHGGAVGMQRNKRKFRELGVRTFHFEYIENQ